MIDKTDSCKSDFSVALLFMFLFGALMTLLYLPPIKEFLADNKTIPKLVMATLVFISSLTASSINAVVTMPCITVLFGCAAALEADRIRVCIDTGEVFWRSLALLVVLVPIYFAISSWGMCYSTDIRECIGKKQSYTKSKLLTYTIMFVGAAVYAAVQAMIFI